MLRRWVQEARAPAIPLILPLILPLPLTLPLTSALILPLILMCALPLSLHAGGVCQGRPLP